ncbi:FAD-dependent oxidoreductase [Rhodopirellula sp. SWK7]|uniref:FAD-dependent oxidoreductase n=1 Tax=Rhodopirellula sp. SWK7 TaxID=595460 RepID=UPI001360B1CE|nr:FAD-dependent oxidoreductase [Rhodopirellula sp. SWK7]
MNLYGQSMLVVALLMGGVACGQERVEYRIPLHDPVKPDAPAIPFKVELILDAHGFPFEYRMPLTTGVCLDGTCKPLQATLFWDAFGNYSRLDYNEGAPLTKGDHKPFTESDYDRLDQILKDKRSILGTYPLDYFLIKPDDRYLMDVDGITSATPPSVKDAVVDKAAYTSWALWHWVNGSIVDRLHAKTVARVDDDYLLHGLTSDEASLVTFSLEQLEENGLQDPRHHEACFHVLENSGRSNCESALKLLTQSAGDTSAIFGRLVGLIGQNGGSSDLILSYFEKLPNPAPVVWIELAKQLEVIPGYGDLDAAFALLQKHAGGVPEVCDMVSKLADSEDRFIARRAQEFIDAHRVQGPNGRKEPRHGEGAAEGTLHLHDATGPYQIPYGTLVPEQHNGILFPVGISSTHAAMCSVRMEPVWPSLGQAAGAAAALAIDNQQELRDVSVKHIQDELLKQKCVLFFYTDLPSNAPSLTAAQKLSLLGAVSGPDRVDYRTTGIFLFGQASKAGSHWPPL